MKTGVQLMREARVACNAIADGPVTPVVFERYGPLIGGETGWCTGYPSSTVSGRGCIIWTHKPDKR